MSNIHTYTDEQLAGLLKKDDKAAFAELYNRYWQKLLVQALCKLKSEPEAEEIVQNVFLNIWRRRNELEIRHTFYTYIASCVKYEVLAAMAKSHRKKTFESESSHLIAQTDNHTTEWLDYEFTRKVLEESIQSLPEKCRLVFRLSREEGFSEKQIAESLGISVKAVEAHKTKALKFLRSSLHKWFLFLS